MSSFAGLLQYVYAPGTASEIAVQQTADQAASDPGSTMLNEITKEDTPFDSVKAYKIDALPSPRDPAPASLKIMQVSYVEGDNGRVGVSETVVSEPQFYKFYVLGLDMPQVERHMILSTFGDDPDFFMTFGEEPHIWSINGMLRNEGGAGAWYEQMDNLYRTKLRASILVENNRFVRFRIGNSYLDGYILSFRTNKNSQYDDAAVDFSMSMYVRKHTLITSQSGEDFEPLSSSPSPGVHVVKNGDTLFDIAQKYGTTVEELRRLNGRTPQEDIFLQAGSILTLPGAQPALPRKVHTVVVGQSLSSVANRYNVTNQAIVDANPPSSRAYNREWNDAFTIYAGEQLIIPD
jgi:LysM repeat protein